VLIETKTGNLLITAYASIYWKLDSLFKEHSLHSNKSDK